jgi:hypothetical protein
MVRRARYIATGVSALALFIASAVSAPHAWALSVTPPRTEVRLAAGAETTAILTVTNPEAEAYDVELSEKPWFNYPDNKQIQVEDWLHLPGTKRFRLKPGKSRHVKITIACPKEAVGELMGMVSFTYQGMQPSMITPMISTAIYLEVMGTERNAGEVVALGAGTRNGRFQVGAQIKATGNVRIRPAGTVQLLNDQGQTVSSYTITEGNPIFPGTLRDYPASGPDSAPAAGHYTLSAEIHSGTLELKAEQGILVKPNGDVEIDRKKEEQKT